MPKEIGQHGTPGGGGRMWPGRFFCNAILSLFKDKSLQFAACGVLCIKLSKII